MVLHLYELIIFCLYSKKKSDISCNRKKRFKIYFLLFVIWYWYRYTVYNLWTVFACYSTFKSNFLLSTKSIFRRNFYLISLKFRNFYISISVSISIFYFGRNRNFGVDFDIRILILISILELKFRFRQWNSDFGCGLRYQFFEIFFI
jgi:hypothetical protein